MAAKISKNATTLHHGLAYNDHKTSFRCIKTHLSNILKIPWISPRAFTARGRHCKAMCYNFASK